MTIFHFRKLRSKEDILAFSTYVIDFELCLEPYPFPPPPPPPASRDSDPSGPNLAFAGM